MATGEIKEPLNKDNSLKVLINKQVTNSNTISIQLPDIGSVPILFIYEGGKWNASEIHGAIGLVRYYVNAPQWNNAILLANSGIVSAVGVSDQGLLTVTLTAEISYNRLKLLSQ